MTREERQELRRCYASAALQGIMTQTDGSMPWKRIAEHCFCIAEAMLQEDTKRCTDDPVETD